MNGKQYRSASISDIDADPTPIKTNDGIIPDAGIIATRAGA